MHHPTDRIAHTTAFVTPVVEHWLEREITLERLALETKHSLVRYWCTNNGATASMML